MPIPAELRNDRYRTRHHIGNAVGVLGTNLRLELPVRNSDLPAHVSLYRILVSYPIRSVCIVSLYCILVSYPFCTNTYFDRIVLLDISILIGYKKYTTFLGYD